MVGSKTRTIMNQIEALIAEKISNVDVEIIDISEYDILPSDGRPYLEYPGDTGYITKTIMEADAVIIGTPTFQASIPGMLKNVLDLLPADAFMGKVVGLYATAGTAKHYLMVEQQLKPIISYMKARLIHDYVFVEESDFCEGKLINPMITSRLDHLVVEVYLESKHLGQVIKDYAF